MIAFVSQNETLHAGEVFGSGTLDGCSGLQIERWLKDGDVVGLEITGGGSLRNRMKRRLSCLSGARVACGKQLKRPDFSLAP